MPDQRAPELSRQWLEKATEDLEAARRLTDLPHVCSFHSQQAVEKGIKALLVLSEVDFAKTHDIDILLRQLGEQGVTPGQVDPEELAALTRFAVDTRYPPETASPKEAQDALDLAAQFVDWAETQIPAIESGREDGDGDQGP